MQILSNIIVVDAREVCFEDDHKNLFVSLLVILKSLKKLD